MEKNEKTFQPVQGLRTPQGLERPKESKQELTPGQKLKLEFIDSQDKIWKQIKTKTLNQEGLKSIIDRGLENGLLREFKNREEKLKVEAADFVPKLDNGIKYKNLDPKDFMGALEMAITEFKAVKPTDAENYGVEEKIQAEKGRKLWGFVFKADQEGEMGYFLKRTKKDKDETPGISKVKWDIFNACQRTAEAFQDPDYQKELEKNKKEGKIRRTYWEPSCLEIDGRIIALPPIRLLKEKGLEDLRPARDFFQTLREAVQFLKNPEYKSFNKFLQENGFATLLELDKKDEEKGFKKENLLRALEKAGELKIVQPIKARREELDQLKEQGKLLEFLIFGYNPVTRTSTSEWRFWQLLENPDPAQNSIFWEIFKKIKWYRTQVIIKEKAAREKRERERGGQTRKSEMPKKEEGEIWKKYLAKQAQEKEQTPPLTITLGEKMKEEGLTAEKLFKKKKGKKKPVAGEKIKGWGEKGRGRGKGEEIEDEKLENEKLATADKKEEGAVEKETKTSTPSIPKEEKSGVSLGELIDIKKKIEEKKGGRGKEEK